MSKNKYIRKTKIVATLGPATYEPDSIFNLAKGGVDVVRINMSHEFNYKSTSRLIKNIREAEQKLDRPISIVMDLCGPKIRVSDRSHELEIKAGNKYTIGRNADINLNTPIDMNCVEVGSDVLIDDGKLMFKVTSVVDISRIKVESLNSGKIKSGKGVNLPGLSLDFPSLQEKDIEDAKFGIEQGVDWIALSFVRTSNDRAMLDEIFKELGSSLPIIAKIEKPEAVDNLESIVESFDGILIARGDLGIEIGLENVPSLQKKIIKLANRKCKPVITATQMLESMINEPAPTRAEVSDVASAVYDGTDAVMLSGETAVGSYPVECVDMMTSIIKSTEQEIADGDGFESSVPPPDQIDVQKSICHAAFQMSADLDVRVMVVMTQSGTTGNITSSYRPRSHIIAMTPSDKIYRRMSLTWGVSAHSVEQFADTDQMLAYCREYLVGQGLVVPGDSFILTAGIPVGVTGSTNMIRIETVE